VFSLLVSGPHVALKSPSTVILPPPRLHYLLHCPPHHLFCAPSPPMYLMLLFIGIHPSVMLDCIIQFPSLPPRSLYYMPHLTLSTYLSLLLSPPRIEPPLKSTFQILFPPHSYIHYLYTPFSPQLRWKEFSSFLLMYHLFLCDNFYSSSPLLPSTLLETVSFFPFSPPIIRNIWKPLYLLPFR